MLLEGKVCLITGSGGGMGQIAPVLFAREGARVVVSDVDEDGGAQTVSQIEGGGGEAIFVRADVSQNGEVEALFRRATERFGRIDVSYHNAGIMHPSDTGPVETPLDV